MIGIQRAVAFALQDCPAVGGLQAEVVALTIRVFQVVLQTVFDPVVQALEGELLQ